MKKKSFLPLILSILVGFGLMFSACSKGTYFNFDENGTVQLTYTCEDEEKNFDAELTAEQSRQFILSLNKISYSEVTDKDIDLAPSYDSLNIKINDETLSLFDIGHIINYGGYFYLNGNLCQSEEEFSFLVAYLAEYCPDIIPNRVPFAAQYVHSYAGAEEKYQIIKSVKQLNDYIATETQDLALYGEVLFKDEVVSKYNSEYFKHSFLVVFMKILGSGSYGFRVNNTYMSRDRLIIDYEIVRPTGEDVAVTCDIAYWYSFVELGNEYNTIKNVDLISLK